MRVLILSCSTGGGHNAAAHAIEEEMKRRGHTVTVLDPYVLKGRNLDHKVGDFYIHLVQRAPSLFGVVYRMGELYCRLPWRSPVYWVNGRMCSRMKEYLEAHPVDVIIMTHLFPGEILTYMKNQGIALPETVFVATDYTCIPFTEEIDCDYYVIPSAALEAEYEARGIDGKRLVPYGIPVAHAFGEKADRAKLLDSLGLAAGRHYLLLSGGSMGAGKIFRMVETLLDYLAAHADTSLIVVCGSNDRLYERIFRRYGKAPQMILLHHTDRMADYMKISDVFLSKPGGLSSTEAAASGVPLIHISPIPGCETRNMDFFAEKGMSIEAGNDEERLVPALEKLRSARAVSEIRGNQRAQVNPFAAKEICELVERTAGAGKHGEAIQNENT